MNIVNYIMILFNNECSHKEYCELHYDSLKYMSAVIMNKRYREFHCDSLQYIIAVIMYKDI